MTTLFRRRAIVRVAEVDFSGLRPTLEIDGLRVAFKAEKTLKPEPSTLDLSITNLSGETRAQLQKKGALVQVLAGYDGNGPEFGSLEMVFSGDARTIDHMRKGPDWITRIQCGDGERAYQYARAHIGRGAGAAITDVVKDLTGRMGVGLGNALAQIKQGNFRGGVDQFLGGFTYSGPAAPALDRVLKSAGYEWSIQDGQLQVLKPGQATTDSVILLSPDSGLVGSPEHGTPDVKGIKPSVLKVRSLLMPSIRPGRRVRIECEGINGLYRAEKVSHTGDTAGADWFTDMECLPV